MEALSPLRTLFHATLPNPFPLPSLPDYFFLYPLLFGAVPISNSIKFCGVIFKNYELPESMMLYTFMLSCILAVLSCECLYPTATSSGFLCNMYKSACRYVVVFLQHGHVLSYPFIVL